MNIAIHHILSRRSIRKFTDQPILKEDLRLILRCGQYAPTAMGVQPWHFSIITQREILDAISERCAQLAKADPNCAEWLKEEIASGSFDTFRGAPCAVIISGEKGQPFAEVDCANAATCMAIAAQSMELGSCYIASFRPAMQGEEGRELRELCRVPENYEPYFALAIGRPAEAPTAAQRREGTISYL